MSQPLSLSRSFSIQSSNFVESLSGSIFTTWTRFSPTIRTNRWLSCPLTLLPITRAARLSPLPSRNLTSSPTPLSPTLSFSLWVRGPRIPCARRDFGGHAERAEVDQHQGRILHACFGVGRVAFMLRERPDTRVGSRATSKVLSSPRS